MNTFSKMFLIVVATMLTACATTMNDRGRMQVMAVPPQVGQQVNTAFAVTSTLPPQKGSCQMPKDSRCLQFVFPNATGHMEGDRIGDKLWNGMISGQIPTSGEGNAFMVMLFDVDPMSVNIPTAYTINIDDYAVDPNRRIKTDLTTWVDVTSTVQGTMVEGSRPTRAYVVRTSGPHPMAAVLQFPKLMFSPKSQAMVCAKGPFQNTNPGPMRSFGVSREDIQNHLGQQKHSLIFSTEFAGQSMTQADPRIQMVQRPPAGGYVPQPMPVDDLPGEQ